MSSKIICNQIEALHIGSLCHLSEPCTHSCKIILSDGRLAEPYLGGPEIVWLINAISADKVKCNSIEHFKEYKIPHKGLKKTSRGCGGGIFRSKLTVDDMLTLIFKHRFD